MTAKQTTVRMPWELADEAEAVARIRGISLNSLIIEALTSEIERLRSDPTFAAEAQRLLTREQELLQRLVRRSG